jgi:peroxiredoxin
MQSNMAPLGAAAPPFNLPDAYGKLHALDDFREKKVLAVVFMCNHCPYVKAVLPRLIDLQNAGAARGVQLVGINPNDATRYPDDSPESMRRLAAEKNIPFPYLIDASQAAARAYDAVCTPDFFVYGPRRVLQYRGRLDDNWQDPAKVTRRDLQLAIGLILDGKEVFAEQVPSMGCSIKWK